MKEIKNLSKWKDVLCTWIRKLNIVKITCSPNRSTDSKQSVSKSQIDKLILKFIERYKEPRIAKTILKKNGVGRVTLTDFRT